MDTFHTSVLQKEVATFLDVREGKKYIDATLGGGGHARAILEKGGIVLGIDTDQDAIDYVKEKVKTQKSKVKNWERLTLVQGNFKDIGEIAKTHGFKKVDGILLDIGVSSYQLNTKDRGFSFQNFGPLDMRMDKSLSVTAKDLVNGLGKGELYTLFKTFGEERYARTFSESIVRARTHAKITTTGELADIIRSSVRGGYRDAVHPATKVFQALRIAVNDELHSIEDALPQALDLLDTQGRVVVISFHSLEDRIVKHTFSAFEEDKKGIILTEKPVVPTDAEVAQNYRSRSAKLRAFKKI